MKALDFVFSIYILFHKIVETIGYDLNALVDAYPVGNGNLFASNGY